MIGRVLVALVIVINAGDVFAGNVESVSGTERLCAPKPPPSASGDELRMMEEDFSQEKFKASIEFLEVHLPKLIEKKEKTRDLVQMEAYYIGYPNSLRFIKGYVLRQEAATRKIEADLVAERARAGKASQEEAARASNRFQEAREAFCSFVGRVLYSD